MKKSLVCVAILASSVFTTTALAEEHWGYEGKTGPAHWGGLNPDFSSCGIGKEQSPIDIRRRDVKKQEPLPAIGFDYAASPAEIVNNGHTVQVNFQSGGTVQLASGNYKLLQFHFHSPSEEKIEGKNFPLVVHFVHKAEDGKLAVVAVLFKQGKNNPALAKVLDVMPTQKDEKTALGTDFNPADLLPANRAYYSFIGSLTTPPCSEGVQWQVMKSPVELSSKQIKMFQKLYPHNARPVQPLHGREIKEG